MALLGWGLFAALVFLLAWMDLSSLGFPDGFLSPYERSTITLRTLLVWASLLVALGCLAFGSLPRTPRAGLVAVLIAASGVLVLAPTVLVPVCPDYAFCRGLYLKWTGSVLDDGIGG